MPTKADQTPSPALVAKIADRLWRLPHRAHVISKAAERTHSGRGGMNDRAAAVVGVTAKFTG